MKLIQIEDYLLLIDEEAEIKEGNIAIYDFGMGYELEIPCNKDNLKSNTRKLVIAYYPLSKESEELDLPLLPPFDGDDIEKLACNIYNLSLDEYEYINENLSQNRNLIEEHYKDINRKEIAERYFDVISFIAGYNAAQSKGQYSLEDMLDVFEFGLSKPEFQLTKKLKEDFTKFIQSLSTQQLPVSFEPEYEITYKEYKNGKKELISVEFHKITNSEGKEFLVGTYKY